MVFDAHQTASETDASDVTPSVMSSWLDESDHLVSSLSKLTAAPATINLFAQMMVHVGTINTSFQLGPVDHQYKYIKDPRTLADALLQISNGIFSRLYVVLPVVNWLFCLEIYHAFLNAHLSMNKIPSYVKQIS